MPNVDEVEQAVLESLTPGEETLPKTVIDDLQQRPQFTDAMVSAAIWRLVANRRVQLTKSLRLRAEETSPSANF